MAEFKTGYLARAVQLDVDVIGEMKVGDFAVYDAATGTLTKATASQVESKQATHIVALTDMTMGTGHVPTDMKDYRPSDFVTAGTDKKVALYPIWDWNDIIPAADKSDRA